ncbi:MAG: hypothetical protein JXR64_04245 [Spirochaetales bacterium]|nr:hypothetical protein [Spirochaetales bacterium]
MNNIFTRSIFYVLISYILLSIILFFNITYYDYNFFKISFEYTFFNLLGLFIFISQFLLVNNSIKIKNLDILINTIILTTIYNICKNIIYGKEFEILINIKNEIFIYRAEITKFNFFNINVVKKIIDDVKLWDINNLRFISSFSLLLFNISAQSYFKRKYRYNTLIRVFIVLAIFFFYLYLWNYNMSLFLIILSILFISSGSFKNEKF